MINKSDITRFEYFFLLSDIKKIIPIKKLDVEDLSNFLFIDEQKKLIFKNTKYFIQNKVANNVLLWGERGNGKSSLILSTVNEINKNFKNKIKIIEVLSSDLNCLPQLVYKLSNISEKFIIYIDDISFEKNERNFKIFKVILQGSMLSYCRNILFYTTSNIRNLSFSKNSNFNDIEFKDDQNNILSLQERFGLKLGFHNFSKEQFLILVTHYANKKKLKLSLKEIEKKSLNWSVQKGSFSGRVASQFISNYLLNNSD